MSNSIFEIPEYEGCGIYAIINVQKMMCYIGSTVNIKKRAMEHKNSLKRNRHTNKLLQSDYNEGATLDFIILEKIVENVETDFLIAKEKMYMLSAIDNCFSIYNLLPKTDFENQREWICTHLLWYFIRKYDTKDTLIKRFKEKYGVTPAYMKNRKEENRLLFSALPVRWNKTKQMSCLIIQCEKHQIISMFFALLC